MEGIEGAALGYSGSRVQWHIVVWMGWPSKHPKLEPHSVATLSPELRSMQIHRHTWPESLFMRKEKKEKR